MMKKIFTLLALAGLFLTSCNTTSNKTANEETKEKKECISVDEFLANADSYVGKEIDIDGTVDHVCKHGGKRMFIFGKNPENRAKIVTGEELANFDVALEGSDVCVHGMVEELRIDEAYLTEWEAEIEAKMDMEGKEMSAKKEEEHDGHEHGDETKHGDKADMGEHKAEIEKIKMYRDKLATDSVDHLSFYSIVATKFHKMEAKKATKDATEDGGCETDKKDEGKEA